MLERPLHVIVQIETALKTHDSKILLEGQSDSFDAVSLVKARESWKKEDHAC